MIGGHRSGGRQSGGRHDAPALVPVDEIARRINAMADELCRELLPNGRRHGKVWQFSGMADTGNSWSAWCYLDGTRIGHWQDAGNALQGEDHGDMIDLLRIKLGLADTKAAIAEAKDRLGIVDMVDGKARRLTPQEREALEKAARDREAERQKREAAEFEKKARWGRALYLGDTTIGIEGTPVEAYLRARMIGPGAGRQWPGALRFNPGVKYQPTGERLPAMVAPIYRADGQLIGAHRTYLALDGGVWGKIKASDAKKVLGNMWGGFVPISKGASGRPMSRMPEGEPVYICEGIEDALCIRMMKPEARIVSAITLGNMGGILLPRQAQNLVLVCDRDSNTAAQDALERSIAAQQARGLKVSTVMPPAPHKDINDWWRALCAQESAA